MFFKRHKIKPTSKAQACQNIEEYVLLDLKPVLDLAERYLSLFPLNPELTFKTLNQCSRHEAIDLVISNYAFSEISRDIQEIYVEKIIQKSKRGYITYNEINKSEPYAYSKNELLSIIPGSVEYPEIPMTNPHNCIIVWGNQNPLPDKL